jgi:hypothetical protein
MTNTVQAVLILGKSEKGPRPIGDADCREIRELLNV